jgi:AraC-like DNA-binding protein
MQNVFSIDSLPTTRREAAWRDAVCNTFVRLECQHESRFPVHGRLQAGVLGGLHVARVTASPQRVERTAARAAQDDQAFVLASVQLRGTTVVSQGKSQALLAPGCIAFYDTARPYTLTLPNDFDQIVLHLPRNALERSVPRGLNHMAQRLSAANPFAQAIMALAPQLLRLVDSAKVDMAERTAAAAVELISLALDSLDASDAEASTPQALATDAMFATRAGADALVWRTRDLIATQLADTALCPSALAVQARVSLRRLQEVFQAQGTTLSDCIWDMRLEFARSLLAAPHQAESVSTIAYRAGFTDVAHFSRRFKKRYSVPPSAYRSTLV